MNSDDVAKSSEDTPKETPDVAKETPTEAPNAADAPAEAPKEPAPAAATESEPEKRAASSEALEASAATATVEAAAEKPSPPKTARMSLSFIQGDDEAPKTSPEVAKTSPKAPDASEEAAKPVADAPEAAKPVAEEPKPAADTTVDPDRTTDPDKTTDEAEKTMEAPAAPVDTVDAAAVAADDSGPVPPPNKVPKHHHHHHHRSFRNLRSKQDVNNKDVYSFVKSTPFPQSDLGVLEYTTNMDTCLQGVLLPNLQLHVDCTIQVLIPRKHLRKESNVMVQRREIWGTDIYTDDSDVVSVLYHTGILPTKAQVEAFYKTLRTEDEEDDGHLEDENPVTVGPNSHLVVSTSDTEQVYGDCLVTLRALPKLMDYEGCYRNGVNSRTWTHHDGGSYAVQKVEFLKHTQAEYVLRRSKRSRLNTWSDQQKWAEWSSHKEVVLDFKDNAKEKKAVAEELFT